MPAQPSIDALLRSARDAGAAARLDEAVSGYLAALDRAPGDAAIHEELGEAFTQRGRVDEAAHAYRRAIELAPDAASPWLKLGILMLRSGPTG